MSHLYICANKHCDKTVFYQHFQLCMYSMALLLLSLTFITAFHHLQKTQLKSERICKIHRCPLQVILHSSRNFSLFQILKWVNTNNLLSYSFSFWIITNTILYFLKRSMVFAFFKVCLDSTSAHSCRTQHAAVICSKTLILQVLWSRSHND